MTMCNNFVISLRLTLSAHLSADIIDPDLVAPSYAVYKGALTSGQRSKPGHIFLQHDINMKTALELAPRAIDLALKKGYKVVTVGTCLGDSPSKWYRA